MADLNSIWNHDITETRGIGFGRQILQMFLQMQIFATLIFFC